MEFSLPLWGHPSWEMESLKVPLALCLLLCGVLVYIVLLFTEEPKGELLPDADVQDFRIKKIAVQAVKRWWKLSSRFSLDSIARLMNPKQNTSSSWGESFEAYLSMINQLNYPKEHLSLGLLVNTVEEYERMKATITRNYDYQLVKYRHVTIILRHQDLVVNREVRHQVMLQKIRRRTIARMRNLLLYSTLRTQNSVLWIDSDIIRIPSDMLRLMLNSDKDIITARCRMGRFVDYDLNAWKGPRSKPTPEELDAIREGGFWEPKPAADTKHVSQLRNHDHPEPDFFVEVDSVGGTVLFVKGDIHRQGIGFTTSYIIGTEWEMEEGWDGIETEGICYLARPLGYKCWAMPNIVVEHVER